MDIEQIRNHIEELGDDSILELTERQIKKYTNLVNELQFEVDITREEVLDELQSISPDDADEWMEFMDTVADFILSLQDTGDGADN